MGQVSDCRSADRHTIPASRTARVALPAVARHLPRHRGSPSAAGPGADSLATSEMSIRRTARRSRADAAIDLAMDQSRSRLARAPRRTDGADGSFSGDRRRGVHRESAGVWRADGFGAVCRAKIAFGTGGCRSGVACFDSACRTVLNCRGDWRRPSGIAWSLAEHSNVPHSLVHAGGFRVARLARGWRYSGFRFGCFYFYRFTSRLQTRGLAQICWTALHSLSRYSGGGLEWGRTFHEPIHAAPTLTLPLSTGRGKIREPKLIRRHGIGFHFD